MSSIFIEYSKSNRAKCKVCRNPIAKGHLRIGRTSPDENGFTSYFHLMCWSFPRSITDPEQLQGFNQLLAKDKESLKNLFKSKFATKAMCFCGKEAVEYVTKKEGPNKGRKFYSCGENRCYFFKWIDEPKQSNEENKKESETQSSKESIEMCSCGIEAIEKPTKKEGPNKGRKYYSCKKESPQRCNFFKWIDPPTEQTNTEDKQEKKDDQQYCYCKIPAVLRVTKKQGTNQGRQFWTCSNFGNERCKFFKWTDKYVDIGETSVTGKRKREDSNDDQSKKQPKITDFIRK